MSGVCQIRMGKSTALMYSQTDVPQELLSHAVASLKNLKLLPRLGILAATVISRLNRKLVDFHVVHKNLRDLCQHSAGKTGQVKHHFIKAQDTLRCRPSPQLRRSRFHLRLH